MNSKIYYWAFEGNEGTGKTTLSKAFASSCGAFWTYEPNGETSDLKKLRDMALTYSDQMTVYGREYINLANRSIHQVNQVRPLLDNLETVVTDRSFLSGMVYARFNGISFKQFMEMSENADIHLYPDFIIYCTSNKRKIVKGVKDIYDNASEEELSHIDNYFVEALDFIKEYSITKHIRIIYFENDFKVSSEKNNERLIKEIKEYLQESC